MMVSTWQRRSRGMSAAGLWLVAAALCGAAGSATAQDEGGALGPAIVQDAAVEEAGAPSLPDSLRNPRVLRREELVAQGPRMVAGGMPITSETFLDHYVRLEPIIGDFNFTGLQFRSGDAEPEEFSGTWTNRWILDGLYLESTFTLTDRAGDPYQVLGLTWFDDGAQQFRAKFLNSANQNQSIRHGHFDDAAALEEFIPDSEEGTPPAEESAAAESVEHLTLTMYGRNAEQPAESEPVAKFELTIVSVNEFRYVGYNRPRNAEPDEWRKSFEMTMTRSEPIDLE